ncbi:MAG: hypothetical protein UC361_01105 [Bulleidia sp.]|nr:hypothetical protein [Bulleidia sp.]
MKYRNIKNGAVIDISCILTDVDWEALEPSEPQSVEEPQENEAPSVEEPQETEEKSVEVPQAKATKKPQKKTGKKG